MAGTFSNLLLHIVFSTKHRAPLITPGLRPRLYKFMGGIIRDEKGVLMEIGGVADHVHLLARWRPDESVAYLLRNVKARSSKWVNDNRLSPTRFQWQQGYSVFSVSRSQKDRVAAYIGKQEEHHKRFTYRQELLRMLKDHDVEFDERYVTDEVD
jgi:putative transposase